LLHIYLCRLVDLVGFGVAIATGSQFIQNFPERTYKSMLIPLLQEDKRAGKDKHCIDWNFDEIYVWSVFTNIEMLGHILLN